MISLNRTFYTMNPKLLLSRITVVLSRPSHPGNIGAAARAMKTMGLSRLTLVQPKCFPDPEAEARAAGAGDVLLQASLTDSLKDALNGKVLAVALSARQRELGPAVSMPRSIAREIIREAENGEVALVFGNESTGLSNSEIQLCQAAVTIPANPAFSSLNLGAAVQLLCYECRMAAYDDDPPAINSGVTRFESDLATHDEIEGFYHHLVSVMTDTGFLNPEQPGRLMPKLRRMFSRTRLERDEVNILRGILSATQTPTKHGKR